MPRREFALSGYRGMWLFAMFDLPVTTKEDKQRYVEFRSELMREGFAMLQYSVYARYCSSEDGSDALRKRLRNVIPEDGHVRLIAITDRQFGKMEVFYGKTPVPPEAAPEQLLLF